MKPEIIAYYLPQFHPFKENDEWWGKGFTEWTNVGKAKPLYKGHYQPKVPADLGYYDLRVPEVREQQVELAKEAGVYGFCYWHYWFGNGVQLMNDIIDDVAASGKPDFPFCLGWANESWKAKLWNKDGKGDKVLVKQKYGGEEDYRSHYEYVKTLITNKNYIRIENRPFFLIYQPFDSPEVPKIMRLWNKWIKEDGIADSFYFVASIKEEKLRDKVLSMGFDAITIAPGLRLDLTYKFNKNYFQRAILKIMRIFRQVPRVMSMKDFNKLNPKHGYDDDERTIPSILPQWDHTPRSGVKGYVLEGTPKLFEKQCEDVLNMVKHKKNKLIFLKSWNEWGEGNYMEPDLKNGKGYIEALRQAINKVCGEHN